MALCKLCHWVFDKGLLTASTQHVVVVSGLVSAGYNVPAHLPGLAGRQLTLPSEEAYWPSEEAYWPSEEAYWPSEEAYWPSQDALKWHKHEVYPERQLPG